MKTPEMHMLPRIDTEHIQRYLRERWFQDAEIVSIEALGSTLQEGLKDYGYGRPLHISFRTQDEIRHLVLRTMVGDPFGHDRRADRANTLLLAYDTFHSIPQHIEPLDVGAFDDQGNLISIPRGEMYLITNFVEGELYAKDLLRMSLHDTFEEYDLLRAKALARYLATLHGETELPALYIRQIRDVVGSGEGIMGLCDSYPDDHPVASPHRLKSIEIEAIRWRWHLKSYSHRTRRTHGDFHPFNLLFRTGTDFSVLDCSRGGVGDPADDLAALSINYIFFSLQHHRLFRGALREVWNVFWHTYLEETDDQQVFEVIAPFFTWRSLVLASPVWYPNISDTLRDRLLRFAEKLLENEPFHPDRIDELL